MQNHRTRILGEDWALDHCQNDSALVSNGSDTSCWSLQQMLLRLDIVCYCDGTAHWFIGVPGAC